MCTDVTEPKLLIGVRDIIDKKEFEKQIFTSTGIIKPLPNQGVGKVPIAWQPGNDKTAELREKIRDIMFEKVDEYRIRTNKQFGDYTIIEECCRIPTDTMKKALNGRYKITRNFLAKFTVGLKLNLELANSLFGMHSGELNGTNDFDYIVFHALTTKDQIDDFIEEVEELLGINLDKTK